MQRNNPKRDQAPIGQTLNPYSQESTLSVLVFSLKSLKVIGGGKKMKFILSLVLLLSGLSANASHFNVCELVTDVVSVQNLLRLNDSVIFHNDPEIEDFEQVLQLKVVSSNTESDGDYCENLVGQDYWLHVNKKDQGKYKAKQVLVVSYRNVGSSIGSNISINVVEVGDVGIFSMLPNGPCPVDNSCNVETCPTDCNNCEAGTCPNNCNGCAREACPANSGCTRDACPAETDGCNTEACPVDGNGCEGDDCNNCEVDACEGDDCNTCEGDACEVEKK